MYLLAEGSGWCSVCQVVHGLCSWNCTIFVAVLVCSSLPFNSGRLLLGHPSGVSLYVASEFLGLFLHLPPFLVWGPFLVWLAVLSASDSIQKSLLAGSRDLMGCQGSTWVSKCKANSLLTILSPQLLLFHSVYKARELPILISY